MDEKHLQRMQKELEQEIDKEVELEKHIEESSLMIARELITKKRTVAIIDKKEYTFMYTPYKKGEIDMISIIIIDNFHFKIGNGKYRPFTAQAEMDKEHEEEENISFVVESFIRHVSGLIRPEEIED